jgi:hypothetical protein
VSIFLRGFVIVALVSLNVRMIGASNYPGMFLTGAAISFVWWKNSGLASVTRDQKSALLYALGAGCGTVFGAFLGR